MVKDGTDEMDILGQASDEREICSVGVCVNDETLSVSIARLAGGTIVGRSTSAFGERVIEFILPNATIDHIEAEAYALLESMQDGANWVLYKSWEGEPEDGVSAEVFGFSELRRTWPMLTDSSTGEEERS